jgi:large subunit ribosomal protein L19
MRFLMQSLEEEQVQAIKKIRDFPDFKSGDVLEVQMIVPENQKKMYVYRGVCIARYNRGIGSSFKLYNVFPDGGPVLQHIPLYMPDLVSIKVVGHTPTGSRMKKYHILEDESSKYTFQNQVRQLKIPPPGV